MKFATPRVATALVGGRHYDGSNDMGSSARGAPQQCERNLAKGTAVATDTMCDLGVHNPYPGSSLRSARCSNCCSPSASRTRTTVMSSSRPRTASRAPPFTVTADGTVGGVGGRNVRTLTITAHSNGADNKGTPANLCAYQKRGHLAPRSCVHEDS